MYLLRVPRSILISAGEASGDYYAALLLTELRRRWPDTDFFGCAGAGAGVCDAVAEFAFESALLVLGPLVVAGALDGVDGAAFGGGADVVATAGFAVGAFVLANELEPGGCTRPVNCHSGST